MNATNTTTARCILVGPRGYLLVQHSNCSEANRGKWALPGGRLEPGEDAMETVCRELSEELFIDVQRFVAVGRYEAKGRCHQVFAAEYEGKVERWDESEIAGADWHSLAEIEDAEEAGTLHLGFEAKAIRDLESQAFALNGGA